MSSCLISFVGSSIGCSIRVTVLIDRVVCFRGEIYEEIETASVLIASNDPRCTYGLLATGMI